MKPLAVLWITFFLSLFIYKILCGKWAFAQAGRVALSVMLVFTASGHFAFPAGMAKMLPGFIPYKTEIIYLTGLIEIAGAIGLWIPRLRVTTAWLLIVFFVLILPANIYAVFNYIDYQTGISNGHGPAYLWFRIPLQFLFIVWTYQSSIKHEA